MTRAERREFALFLVAMAALVSIAILATGCRPPCPKYPAPLPPPPVVTVVRPPPCSLPELPQPLPQLGVPDPQRGGYYVPQASWALLGGYQASIREWIAAAAKCLTSGAVHP